MFVVVFFFKQKTAYEMRISDWSSDVCSSDLMPAAIHYSHEILRNLARVRKSAAVPLLLPDSKSQITVLYENDIPKRIETIVVSSHHRESAGSDEVRAIIEDRKSTRLNSSH